jgi:N-glycosylase/DNA lyase
MKKIIVDIDGTIANLDHRLHYILNEDGSQKKAGEKDWEMFGKFISHDNPRKEVIDMIDNLSNPLSNIIFVTGRSERYIDETYSWLEAVGYEDIQLYMREESDRRDDDVVKKEILNIIKEQGNTITHVFEDRPRVLKMYREELPNAIIVDCGNFNHFKDER